MKLIQYIQNLYSKLNQVSEPQHMVKVNEIMNKFIYVSNQPKLWNTLN